MCDAWYDEIANVSLWPWGHYTNAWWKDAFRHNGTIVDSDFTDASLVSWGNDSADERADEADALMVAMHGSNCTGNSWCGVVRVDEAGSGSCYAWQDDIEWGDYDMEFAHLSSCYSMDEEDWWPNWSSSFGGVHQIDGFHGLMWIGTSLIVDYEDFADDAFSIDIAESWLDNMYHYHISGSDDQCPVARGVGYGSSSLWARMGGEQYDNVYSDPVGAGTHGVIYISGCNPSGMPALP
jgi:hypothetical protein